MVNDKKTRQRQGKFYTPAIVSKFCWRVLRARIGNETLHRLRIVDPAVGDGVFLQEACRNGWVDSNRVLGVELFPGVLEHPPVYRMIHGNGLLDQTEQGFQSGAFDLVIGNPPFGGDGIRGLEDNQRQQALIEIVCQYEAWRQSASVSVCREDIKEQWLNSIDGRRAFKKLMTCPIEQLFFERFLMLCDDGGWCVIVLPEGLLANHRAQWLREAVNRQASVEAVISLPAKLFASEGASARTAIVFLHKKAGLSSPIYMVSPTFIDQPAVLDIQGYLELVEAEFSGAAPAKLGLWLQRDEWTDERWDPGFWNPHLRQCLLKREQTVELGEFIETITYGPILPGRQPDMSVDGIPVIGQKQLIGTGVDLGNAMRVTAGSVFDPPRSRVEQGDLLLARSGEGSLLRFKMGVYEEDNSANVSCFVDRIRLSGIDPYYVWLILRSRFLRAQILRLQNGVGTPNLSFQEIRGLRIPWLDIKEQIAWRERYMEQVRPLHILRVQARDNAERADWGERADREFQALVQALEDVIAQQFQVE